MPSFVFYDLIFLVIFTLAVALFLYKRRHNLKRHGLLYLYRTKVGLKVIDWTAQKFGKILKPLQYVVVASGYILMAGMIWFTVRLISLYTEPTIIRAIKVPPILPLFPYATDLFKINFLPPFYFTYFIVVIAVIAVSHEFAHGIFARLNKIKVHSTGFGFLGPFLAAFVEPDEKEMQKAKKFSQLSILAAGTFANVIMMILFALLLWAFFAASFTPAGVNFNAYPNAAINLSSITAVAGVPIASSAEIPNLIDNEKILTQLNVSDESYLVPGDNLRRALDEDIELIVVFEDAPAIRSDLKGAILEIDGEKLTSPERLREVLAQHNPGDSIAIKTTEDGVERDYQLVLEEKDGKAYLGIGFLEPDRSGVFGYVFSFIEKIKDPFVYYAPVWDGNLAIFIYNLLWWIVITNFSVALVNMIPAGIFDGGRFFYLTAWGITRSEKYGKILYRISNWIISLIVIWLMIQWALAFV